MTDSIGELFASPTPSPALDASGVTAAQLSSQGVTNASMSGDVAAADQAAINQTNPVPASSPTDYSGLFGSIGGVGKLLSLVGTGIKAGGQVQQAQVAQNVANYNSNVATTQSNNVMGAAENKAAIDNQSEQLLLSHARALAASGGGSADDPTIINQVDAPIQAQGEYNSMTDLYNGESQSQALLSAAALQKYEADNSSSADYINAGTTLMSGATSTLFSRYAPDPLSSYNSGYSGQ